MTDPNAPFDPDRDDPHRSPDAYRDWDAAYVFGMLGPEERRAFERHLATCPVCTAAVAELAGIPGILGKLNADEAAALLDEAPPATASTPPEPQLVQHLARSVRLRRGRARRRTIVLVSGVGAVLAVAGLFAGFGLGANAGAGAPIAIESPNPSTTATAPADGSSPVEPGDGVARAMAQVEPGFVDADLAVTEKGWGTRFDWNCSYSADLPAYPGAPTITYDLVVTDAQGTETTVASWSAAGEKAGNLSASTSIPTAEVRSVDIRIAGSDRPLVRTTL